MVNGIWANTNPALKLRLSFARGCLANISESVVRPLALSLFTVDSFIPSCLGGPQSGLHTPHTTPSHSIQYTRLKITRKLWNRKRIIPNIAALGRFSNQPSSWKHNLGSNHQYDISVTYLVTPWHRDMTNKSTSHLSLASKPRPYLKCKANSF